ncbi:MAG: RIP metalloprotease RseP, partial [Curvibacter sp.]
MLTVLAFILALGLLIAVHEYGHYRMAVACGVKVLRFSIGFGHTLLRWQPKGSPTEFVVGAFPLGGYVRMLDEREAPVDPAERHLAFNTQPLRARALIVAAGPMANLVLAVLLYAAVNWGGAEMAAPILGRPVPGSVAQQAGLVGGERVAQAGFEGESLEPVLAYEDLRWLLTRGALEGRDVRLVLQDERGRSGAEHVLPLSRLDAKDADARLFEQIGIVAPFSRPEIGEITPDGAAARSDLRTGDLVLSVDAQPMRDSRELRERIRAAVLEGQAVTMLWRVERAGQVQAIKVRPDVVEQGGATIGRIGAFVGAAPEMVTVEYGLFEGVWQGVVKTWDVSVLTLRTLGRMVVGEASLKNLSGPLTIADYAG